MATLGWRPIGDPASGLKKAISACKQAWGSDQAYREVVYKLDKVAQELDTLTASPGRRASLRAPKPNPAGQEPSDRSEAPSSGS